MRNLLILAISAVAAARYSAAEMYPRPVAPPMLHARDNPAQTSLVAPDPATRCMNDSDPSGRGRAWCLYKYLVTGKSGPIWGEWHPDPIGGMNNFSCANAPAPPVAQTGIEPEKLALLQSLSRPRELPVLPNKQSTSAGNKDSSIAQAAGVLFNQNARNYICDSILHGATPTDGFAKMTEVDFPSSAPYPMVIKTVWARLPVDPRNQSIAVWDNKLTLKTIAPDRNPAVRNWKTLIAIDTSHSDAGSCNLTPPPDAKWPDKLPVVPLGCFYWLQISSNDQSAAGRFDPNIIDLHAGTATAYLILVGFHIAAKGSAISATVPAGWT